MWFNAIGSIFKFRQAPCLHDHLTGHVVCRNSFFLELVWEKDSIIKLLTRLPDGTPFSFPFYLTLLSSSPLLYSLSFLPYFPLPFCLDKIKLSSLYSSFGQKYFGLGNYSFSHLRSILLPLESKQCPLTPAQVLACADSADELRF